MIRQKVRLAKLETEDGLWKVEDSKSVGLEFWIDVGTFEVLLFMRRAQGDRIKILCVKIAETRNPIPVELLEFSSDFEVTSH